MHCYRARSGRCVGDALVVGLLAALASGASQAAEPTPGSVSIVFAGDVMLDNGPGHAVMHGTDPFAEFATILRGADISVCNLECAVAEGGKQQLKPYTFLAPPKCVALLKRYFSAVSVANNHSGDFGDEALLEQFNLLEEAQLPYFGGGRNQQEARRPLVLQRHGTRVALLAYNDFPPREFEAGTKSPGIAWLVEDQCLKEIRAVRQTERADIVIPYLHWGSELVAYPEPYQRDLARRMIDAGANAVIGTHAHVTQTVELYKGRPIVYSLGNFVFDYYPDDPPVFTGWIVKLCFGRSTGIDMETHVLSIDKAGIPHRLPAAKDAAPERP